MYVLTIKLVLSGKIETGFEQNCSGKIPSNCLQFQCFITAVNYLHYTILQNHVNERITIIKENTVKPLKREKLTMKTKLTLTFLQILLYISI